MRLILTDCRILQP